MKLYEYLFHKEAFYSRSLYRERGLKFKAGVLDRQKQSRSLYRERGLKLQPQQVQNQEICRSLYRERGLKSIIVVPFFRVLWSLPLPGAWIEIYMIDVFEPFTIVAPFTGSVD